MGFCIVKSAGNSQNTLSVHLRSRRREIEEAVLNRVRSIADPSQVADPSYSEGLRSAVSAALDFALTSLERGDAPEQAVPAELLAQARMAARNDIGLDTVLRRYFAGYTLIEHFLIEAAGKAGIPLGSSALKNMLRVQATALDKLVAVVTGEYNRAVERPAFGGKERRVVHIQRLLDGERIDTSELAYPFDGWHLGLIAWGQDLEPALESIARELDVRLLVLRRPEGVHWAWIGCAPTP